MLRPASQAGPIHEAAGVGKLVNSALLSLINEACVRAQTSTKAANRAKFVKLPLSRSGTDSIKNFWIQVMMWSSTKIECCVAYETSHPSKNFIRVC